MSAMHTGSNRVHPLGHHKEVWQVNTCMPIDTTAQYLSSDLTLAPCMVSLIRPYVLLADTILSGPANKSALRAASLRLQLNEGEPLSDPGFPLLYWPSFSLPFTLRSLALFSSVCMLPRPYTSNHIGRRAQIREGLFSVSLREELARCGCIRGQVLELFRVDQQICCRLGESLFGFTDPSKAVLT